MSSDSSDPRAPKRERREARRRAASRRRRRRRLARGSVLGLVLAIPILWGIDLTGAEERVEAQVLRTHLWRHRTSPGQSHTHSDATLIIEGLNEVTVPRADTLQRGARVDVWIRRGRVSGWPYFVEMASERPGQEAAEPTGPEPAPPGDPNTVGAEPTPRAEPEGGGAGPTPDAEDGGQEPTPDGEDGGSEPGEESPPFGAPPP